MKSLSLQLLFLLGFTYCSFSQTPVLTTSDSLMNLGFNYQRDFRKIQEQSQDKTSPYYYKKLLIRFLNDDSTLSRRDVLALMIGYTLDPNYKPFRDMQTEQEIYDLNDHGQYDEALTQSKEYLQKHPLSLRILKEGSYAYHQLYKKDSADYFMHLVDKIMGAMIYSGKGKSMDKAIFSLGLNDGEHFIANIGMSVNQKNTDWDRNRNFIFIVSAMDNEGTFENWYFNIQHAKLRANDEGVDEETPIDKKKKNKKGDKKSVDNKAKEKGWGGKKGAKNNSESEASPAPEAEHPVPDSLQNFVKPETGNKVSTEQPTKSNKENVKEKE